MTTTTRKRSAELHSTTAVFSLSVHVAPNICADLSRLKEQYGPDDANQ